MGSHMILDITFNKKTDVEYFKSLFKLPRPKPFCNCNEDEKEDIDMTFHVGYVGYAFAEEVLEKMKGRVSYLAYLSLCDRVPWKVLFNKNDKHQKPILKSKEW